jgi:hypothetical protein
MIEDCMPSFFVVGAQKAGTTTLHDLLHIEPAIKLPSIKETHFFSDDKRYAKGLDWYLQWFRCDKGIVRGEVCPEYMFFKETPARMREVVSNPRFVFIFREPIDRAYSHYRMTKRRSYEDLGFAQALEAEENRLNGPDRFFAMTHYSYMTRGRYAEQVDRFQRAFPNSPCLFLTFDEFIGPETKKMAYVRICKFIGIESVLEKDALEKRSNAASAPKFRIIRDLLYRDGGLKRLLRPVVRTLMPSEDLRLKVAMTVDMLNCTAPATSESDERSQVTPEFRQAACEETMKLAELTGLDLSAWVNRHTTYSPAEDRS